MPAVHAARRVGKYSCLEREVRFLASPDAPTGPTTPIVDRYLLGTRLRLRRMGDQWKLGKIVDLASGEKEITNLYLDDAEADLLLRLPAWEVQKERARFVYDGAVWSVDTYRDGTLIAECEQPEASRPPWLARELTGDPEWSGFALAKRLGKLCGEASL